MIQDKSRNRLRNWSKKMDRSKPLKNNEKKAIIVFEKEERLSDFLEEDDLN